MKFKSRLIIAIIFTVLMLILDYNSYLQDLIIYEQLDKLGDLSEVEKDNTPTFPSWWIFLIPLVILLPTTKETLHLFGKKHKQ
jgi:hypothetical protein